ncbi:MAG: hypothetical protein AMJ56_15835, partial [Anaerolineae bacterium SG8_19]
FDPTAIKTLDPVIQSRPTIHPESGGGNAIRSSKIKPNVGPVKKGHIGAGTADFVGVKEVIGADIILVDRFFDQSQTEEIRIKIGILADSGRNGRDVMDTVKLHDLSPLAVQIHFGLLVYFMVKNMV